MKDVMTENHELKEELAKIKASYDYLRRPDGYITQLQCERQIQQDYIDTAFVKLFAIEQLEAELGQPIGDFVKCIKHKGDDLYLVEQDECDVFMVVKVIRDEYRYADLFTGYDENDCFHEIPFACYGETLFFNELEACNRVLFMNLNASKENDKCPKKL